jgi:hypothetical protein
LHGHYFIDWRLIALENSNWFRSSDHVQVNWFESLQTFKCPTRFWPGT